MSLDKAIEHGKENRKPYRGAKAVDASCRNHGDDPWEFSNRYRRNRRREDSAESRMKEYEENLDEPEL